MASPYASIQVRQTLLGHNRVHFLSLTEYKSNLVPETMLSLLNIEAFIQYFILGQKA